MHEWMTNVFVEQPRLHRVSVTTVFVEQPLALPGSAKYRDDQYLDQVKYVDAAFV